MLLWFLKQLPIETIAGAVVLAGALRLASIDLARMDPDLLLDLLDVPDWSGGWLGSPL